jgi:hypothetical protein
MHPLGAKRCSYTWRSIIHGRQLLEKGLIWRIGDGKRVEIQRDNWIPRASIQRPLGIQPGKEAKTISEFLLQGRGGWNEEKLRDTFFESDVTDILSVPVGRAGTENYIA